MAGAIVLSLSACGADQKENQAEVPGTTGAPEQNDSAEASGTSEEPQDVPRDAATPVMDWEECFKGMQKAKAYKGLNDTNPIMTQRFGADPYALVYGDRVYFYMTADAFEYDTKGEVKENSYSQIRSINVVSTDDMVNFTDHGSIPVAGKDGIAKWAANSWAPAAAWKEIDGKPQFFLYFANSGGGIGVLQADSPTGPFRDPLGKALISRETPRCADVLWLFDPAVLVDEDGSAYIYFGGGVPQDKIADPGTARVAKLGADMISIAGEPVPIDVPYLFEDSGIHKYGNKYYYTYCTNWQVDAEGTKKYGFTNAQIACLESDSPMGPFTYKETILENPGKYFGLYGNNHHAVFSFQDRWYITYHTRAMEKAMGIEHGYRCTNIDEFEMGEDGTIGTIRQHAAGREQLKPVDARQTIPAVNMAVQAGLDTIPGKEAGEMILTAIDSGDYLKVQGVDFGETSVSGIVAAVRDANGMTDDCCIQIYIDTLFGDVIGYLPLSGNQPCSEADEEGFTTYEAKLTGEVTGVHDLFFVFSGSGYEMKNWRFK